MEKAPIGVLQSVRMDYSQSVLLYQDKPKYGVLLKSILMLPVVLLVASGYHWFTGDASGGLALLTGALIMGLAFWLLFPCEYQVRQDHLRIVLGGPCSVKVRFQDVKAVRITSRSSFGVNLVTRVTRSHVEIVKKRGFSIAITPTDDEAFVEEANRALSLWVRTRRQ